MPTLLAERQTTSFDLTPPQVRARPGQEKLSRPAQEEFRKGLLAAESGGLEEAEAHLSAFLLVYPTYPPALNNLGVVLRRRGKNDEAEKHFRQALVARPDYPEALNNLGCVLADRGLHEEALRHYRTALEFQPDRADVLFNIGAALLELGRPKQAERYCRKGLEKVSDSVLGWTHLGVALAKQGRAHEAEESYRKALALQPTEVRPINNLGALFYEAQRWEDAEREFRHALALQPDFATAHANLGELLANTGKVEEAIQEFEVAYPGRATISDRGKGLYRAWASMLLREGVKAMAARDINAAETWVHRWIDLQRRAENDHMKATVAAVGKTTRASLPEDQQAAFKDFQMAAKLLAIEDPWEGWHALAKEVGKVWPKNVSAVDAIREERD